MAYEACQLKHHSELQAGHGSSANYIGRGGALRGRGHDDRGRGRSTFRGASHHVLLINVVISVPPPLALHAKSMAKWGTRL
jgi:hypothetical protein